MRLDGTSSKCDGNLGCPLKSYNWIVDCPSMKAKWTGMGAKPILSIPGSIPRNPTGKAGKLIAFHSSLNRMNCRHWIIAHSGGH